jgi:hypothetical protein
VLKAEMQRYISQKTLGSTKEALIAYIEQIQREEQQDEEQQLLHTVRD